MVTNTKEYNRNYYKIRRKRILEYLGGVCVVCGAIDDLQVDHKNRKDKNFYIGDRCSLNQIKDELDKCQLLCKKCHIKKTAEENLGFTHGSIYGWMKKKCNCEICFIEKRKWHDIRNAKRRKASMPQQEDGLISKISLL